MSSKVSRETTGRILTNVGLPFEKGYIYNAWFPLENITLWHNNTFHMDLHEKEGGENIRDYFDFLFTPNANGLM